MLLALPEEGYTSLATLNLIVVQVSLAETDDPKALRETERGVRL